MSDDGEQSGKPQWEDPTTEYGKPGRKLPVSQDDVPTAAAGFQSETILEVPIPAPPSSFAQTMMDVPTEASEQARTTLDVNADVDLSARTSLDVGSESPALRTTLDVGAASMDNDPTEARDGPPPPAPR
ncbi:MAG: hypothetical protein AAFY60_13295, partial [Myxococcota bacterium]